MLIARAFPVMQIYVRKGHNTISHKVHVFTLPHNVANISNISKCCKYFTTTPRKSSCNGFAVTGRNNGDIFFKVGLKKVNDVLVWLKQNNPLYKEALIDQSRLNKLPVNEEINVSVRFIVDCERVPVEENEEEVEVDPC